MYNKKPLQSAPISFMDYFQFPSGLGVKLSKTFLSTIILGHTLKVLSGLNFTSFDKGSYNISLPLKNVIKNGFLALYQNGEPIRPEQGYPVRLIIPGWEGGQLMLNG